jgi:4-hydroxy-3-methylbut-2-enyl diphosphate reductase
VDRAVQIVEIALQRFGAPVYVRKEIVHNQFVVNRLREMGAIFVEELAEVPAGALAIFSAHGVAPAVFEEAGPATSRSSTPPARWSAKCIWRCCAL